eukprot:GEMP01037153.1.p1 GENE.GEMP01037153.1~~GEMP01037153.1.p1  ORF type:complete len:276 (+),score=61.38 GEMP01037153.1:40-828(+)
MAAVDAPPPLFIGGLPQTCSRDDLEAWADIYGPCKKVVVKMDVHTHRSRGFGFVEFENWDSFKTVMEANPSDAHVIQGKQVEVKQFDADSANASKTRLAFSNPPTEDELTAFVGALPQACDDAVLENFGALFGDVESSIVKMDPETGRSRGFGFIKFRDQSAIESACANFESNAIDDKWVDVKQVSKKGATKGTTKGETQDFGGKGSKGFGKAPKGFGKDKGGKGKGFSKGKGGPVPVWDGRGWVQMVPYTKGKSGKGKAPY